MNSIGSLKNNFKAVNNSSSPPKFLNLNLVRLITEKKFNLMHPPNLINLSLKVLLKTPLQKLILNLQRNIKIGLLLIKPEWHRNN